MQEQFEKYEGEFGTNRESINMNSLFLDLQSCGVYGPEDFVNFGIYPISHLSGEFCMYQRYIFDDGEYHFLVIYGLANGTDFAHLIFLSRF